ncbi:MAG: relaxase/mobilization nuclease domain-containing protein [Streptococcus parauberis]
MAVIGKINSVQSVVSSVKYARDGLDKDTKEIKCVEKDGYNINPDKAEWQIKSTAKAYGKEGGVEGYSMVTSFKQGEITPEKALEVVKKTWIETTKDMNGDFPCAFYVHGNTDNIHVHSVAGAIDPQTGIKLSQHRMWELMKYHSDSICLENGLSVITEKAEKRMDHVEFHLNKKGAYSWKSELKEKIEVAFNPSVKNLEDFKSNLKSLGVKVHDRVRNNEQIFMYEFTGKDNKIHKAKDFKLGGSAYEKQTLNRKAKSLNKSKLGNKEKAKELYGFFNTYNKGAAKEKAEKELAKKIPKPKVIPKPKIVPKMKGLGR